MSIAQLFPQGRNRLPFTQYDTRRIASDQAETENDGKQCVIWAIFAVSLGRSLFSTSANWRDWQNRHILTDCLRYLTRTAADLINPVRNPCMAAVRGFRIPAESASVASKNSAALSLAESQSTYRYPSRPRPQTSCPTDRSCPICFPPGPCQQLCFCC